MYNFPPSPPLKPPSSYLLHVTPLSLQPQLREISHLHPLRSDEDTPVLPALEIPLAGGDAAIVLADRLVERDADPGRAGGPWQGGDGADEGDGAPLGGRVGEAAARGGRDICVMLRTEKFGSVLVKEPRRKKSGWRSRWELTPLFDLVPHLADLPFLDLRRGRVEAADLVVLLVGADRVGEGLVLGFGHLIFGH